MKPEIVNQIGDIVKSLDINDVQKQQKYLEHTLESHVNVYMNKQVIPILTFTTCVCGCGDMIVLEDERVLTPQKTIRLLELHIEKMKEMIKKSN